MKKLVLHLGRAKTGSSSLQQALGAASDTLRERGVMYPAFQPYNHSFQFTVLFKEDPTSTFYYKQLAPISDDDWEVEKARLTSQWLEFFASADQGTWVISAENLPAMSVTEIRRLVAFVRPCFDDVEAIVYVRHPESVLKSQWEEFVKVMDGELNGREILAKTIRNYNFRFLNRWSKVLGRDRLTVRPFDVSRFVGGSLQSDFFHFAGLGGLELPADEEVANASLGVEGAAFLQAYNARYPLYLNDKVNLERGLARHQHLLYEAMRDIQTQPLDIKIRFNQEEAGRTNRQIQLVNNFLAPDDHFHEVEASEQLTRLPEASELSVNYLLDLVNKLAQRIDNLVDPRQ